MDVNDDLVDSLPSGAKLGRVQDGRHALGRLVDEDLVDIDHLRRPLHHLLAGHLEKMTLSPEKIIKLLF